MQLKYCYLYKCIGRAIILFLSPIQIKEHLLFHLCHTFYIVVHEMLSATFLQQLSIIKGY